MKPKTNVRTELPGTVPSVCVGSGTARVPIRLYVLTRFIEENPEVAEWCPRTPNSSSSVSPTELLDGFWGPKHGKKVLGLPREPEGTALV